MRSTINEALIGQGRSFAMNYEMVSSDLTVVGAGIAGVCAAIAAARQGLEVTLVHDRPVLGGNSSSEVRVWLNGAAGPPASHPSAARNIRYAREGGIVEELVLKNKYVNPDGNAHLWDMVLMDAVRVESNISLYLNTIVTEVKMDGQRSVELVRGHQLMSERHFEFESPRFVDASGDGVVAYQAGAEFRIGSEGRNFYNERMAPRESNKATMGSTIMFSTKDAGYPIRFIPPAIAHDFKDNPPPILKRRANPHDTSSCWWWIEWGGELDTVGENEAIRDELLAIAYGAWDYVKNSGRFPEAETLQLEWVGSIPGKRESRRFIGPYVIEEDDLVNQRSFDDCVAHGGWPIDIHPPEGFYDAGGRGSRHHWLKGPYEIPYRSLVSKDLDNLWLAGRIASASRVAFGSIRVQMTLGAMGQAIGTAAAIADRHKLTVHDVANGHLKTLQQQLLLDDQWVIGLRNNDDKDIARYAVIQASSVHDFALDGDQWSDIDQPLALTFPVTAGLNTIILRLRSAKARRMVISLSTPSVPQNYIPEVSVEEKEISLEPGEQDVSIDVSGVPTDVGIIVVTLPSMPDVLIKSTEKGLTCVIASKGRPYDEGLFWQMMPWIPAFCADGESPYQPSCVTNGYSRPYGGPNGWISKPIASGHPEWLELEWAEEKTFSKGQITFNSNQNRNLLNLERASANTVPELVRDYRILADVDGKWKEIVQVNDNYQRVRRHEFSAIRASRLRLEIAATNGAPCAEVFEIRVY